MRLIKTVRYRLSKDQFKCIPPIVIEDSTHFDKIINDAPGKLYIIDFTATWCTPCQLLIPVFRMLSLQTPTAVFFKVDSDEVDDLISRFEIVSFPCVCFLRGSPNISSVIGRIEGGGPKFVTEFVKLFKQSSTEQELITLNNFHSNSFQYSEDSNINSSSMLNTTVIKNLSCDENELQCLTSHPLQKCRQYIYLSTREDLNMNKVQPTLSFDVSSHEAAQTAPAQSVLTRFQEDVSAYASYSNSTKIVKMNYLSNQDIIEFFEVKGTIDTYTYVCSYYYYFVFHQQNSAE